MNSQAPCITLLSDFGLQDSYVAQMKGAALSVFAEANLSDLSHEIPHADIRAASFFLSEACPSFPNGSIHVAVIDPGVGTDRRALLLELELQRQSDAVSKKMFFIGPDNGIFTEILAKSSGVRAWSLFAPLRREGVGSTFDGRDLFMPAAARLASGTLPEELGSPLEHGRESLIRFEAFVLEELVEGGLRGVVRSIDRYGNAITNIPAPAANVSFELILKGESQAQRVYTSSPDYQSIPKGAVRALRNSSGFIELAAYCASAAALEGIAIANAVEFRRL